MVIAVVSIKELNPTQMCLKESRIDSLAEGGFEASVDAGELPEVWVSDGKKYIEDGHHRAMLALRRGNSHMRVHYHTRENTQTGNYDELVAETLECGRSMEEIGIRNVACMVLQ
jgi:hypothetical protein